MTTKGKMDHVIIKNGDPVRLVDLKAGSLFQFNNSIAMKTEYFNQHNLIEAFVIGSGEMFYGGTSAPSEQYSLMVQPLTIVDIKG